MGGPETEVEENIPFSLERIRSLRSILCFPCETVHETHKTIFGDLARKEAAVYCAAVLECVCSDILKAAVAVAQSNTFKSQRRRKATQIIPCYIQLALRRNTTLRILCSTCSKLSVVLSHYLDNDTSKVLKEEDKLNDMERTEISQGKAATDMDVQLASQRQSSWGRRKDDVVTDVDLSNLLRKVHPVYSLSNDARLFLAAIVRVLHSEIMKVATVGVTSASFLDAKSMETITSRLMPGKVGNSCRNQAREAVHRFYLRVSDSAVTRIRVRAQDKEEVIGKANFKLDSHDQVGTVIEHACLKLRLKRKEMVFVYAGKIVNETKSPYMLGMSSKSIVEIFALSKKWWQFKQREAARQGLLTSAKGQDLSQLKAAKSRVENRADESLLRKMKGSRSLSKVASKSRRSHSSILNSPKKFLNLSSHSNSMLSIGSTNEQGMALAQNNSTGNIHSTKQKGSRRRSIKVVQNNIFKSRLKPPTKVSVARSRKANGINKSRRILKSPETGDSLDLESLNKLPLLPFRKLYSEKNIRQKLNKVNRKHYSKKNRHRKKVLGKVFQDAKAKEFQELRALRDKKRKHEAALRIQAKFRGVRDRQKAFAAKKQRQENLLKIAREKRRRQFYSSASALLRDAERSAHTWVMLATSIRKTRDWVCHEKSHTRIVEDEEQECFKLSRQLRAHLRNAQDGSRRLQLNLEDPLFEMLEHWEKHLPPLDGKIQSMNTKPAEKSEKIHALTFSNDFSILNSRNKNVIATNSENAETQDFRKIIPKQEMKSVYHSATLSPVTEEAQSQESIFGES